VKIPDTKYAESGGVSIAYQTFGDGPVDIVCVPGWFTNVELTWEDPYKARFYDSLASFARVILFDKRGTGLSDREAQAHTLEERMDDVRAVMDANHSEQACLLGWSEGGPMCALFAATHPDRTASLIMQGSYARRTRTEDYPWGQPKDEYDELVERMKVDWGSALEIGRRAPSLAHDEAFLSRWARYLRMSASPKTAVAYVEMNGDIDVRDILSSIRVPTLILHGTGDKVCRIENGRYLAEKIPGARLIEVETDDHLIYTGEWESILPDIEEFVTGKHTRPEADSVVCTIMFTDIVGSTELASELGDRKWSELLSAHNATVRDALSIHRGIEVKSTGDGFHATFDGPARAIRCARHVHEALAKLDLAVRVGMHTGECVVTRDGIEGIAVHIAARVAEHAEAGEVVVSQTVRDLVAGSGIEFSERGEHELRGIKDSWRLYSVAG
jgi:class 3 adenylate cyclase/alpha-beta hydrolase superfamily lysophospholipase